MIQEHDSVSLNLLDGRTMSVPLVRPIIAELAGAFTKQGGRSLSLAPAVAGSAPAGPPFLGSLPLAAAALHGLRYPLAPARARAVKPFPVPSRKCKNLNNCRNLNTPGAAAS